MPTPRATSELFLPGVPEAKVRAALANAGGKEIESGKLSSPESSAALAVNAFGWFLERPAELPRFPPLADLDWPASKVEVERRMRSASGYSALAVARPLEAGRPGEEIAELRGTGGPTRSR